MGRAAKGFATILATLLLSAPVAAQCRSEPGTPAKAVPRHTSEAPGVDLWPPEIRPARSAETRARLPRIPGSMDSTSYITQSIPGADSGHEFFQDLAVAEGWLVVGYNAGIQVWDARHRPLTPGLRAARDGWRGQWLRHPPSGEVEVYLQSVSAVSHAGVVWIGVAAEAGVGVALWRWDPIRRSLDQLYQRPHAHAEDVEMVVHRGRVYAYTAESAGVHIYDATAASLIGPCVQEASELCTGVVKGRVTWMSAAYLDVLPMEGSVLVAASDGRSLSNAPLRLGVWGVSDSSVPEGAAFLFHGLSSSVFSPQLFEHGGAAHVGVVESGHVDLYGLSHCLVGCAFLGPPLVHESLRDARPSRHYLDIIEAGGVTLAHYGMQTTGLHGSGYERLWRLHGNPPAMVEIAGGMYADPCSGEPVDWLGDYYPGNTHGLRHFSPRHVAGEGNAIYRASVSLLDVLEWRAPTLTDEIFADGFESGDTSAWSGD